MPITHVPGSDRLTHQFYRCITCNRLLTKLEILRRWQASEKHPEAKFGGSCPCGAGKLRATNLTPEEEKRLTSLKQRIRYFLFRISDADTRVVELWRFEVLDVPRGLNWLLPRWKAVR